MSATEPSSMPIPPGLVKPFGCVRALIFQFEDSNFTAIPATGFLLRFLGETFFITTRHAVMNAKFDTKDLCVPYSRRSNRCIPFPTVKTFSAVDRNDTDQVDIIVMKSDRSLIEELLFGDEQPFDVSEHQVVLDYTKGLLLHFKGITPEKNDLNYDDQKFHLHFSSAPAVYEGETIYRSIHMAKAAIPEDFPDFDGLSGSPLFAVTDENSYESESLFAGMLIRGTRSSQILHFIEGARVKNYLLEFFIGHLPMEEGNIELGRIFQRYLEAK